MSRPNSSFRAQSSIPGAIEGGENGDVDSAVGDMEGNGTRLTETDIGAVENEGGVEGDGSEGKSWKAKLCCCCPGLS